jgi:hypothetical protein
MWQKTIGLLGCSLGVLACGAAPPPPSKPVVGINSLPALPLVPASRSASPELRRYWIFAKQDHLALYAGLDSLMHTELFAGLVPGILGNSEEFLKTTQRDCLAVLAAQARELTLGVDERSGLMALELGPEGVKAARAACVGSLFPVERAKVAGADEAYAAGDDVVVIEPGVVLFGSKELVERALASAKAPAPFPASLTLKDDQQVVFQASVKGISGKGALRVSSEHFRLEVESDVPNAGFADMVEHNIKDAREHAQAFAAHNPAAASITKLFDLVQVERRGTHFAANFELREPAIDQARDVSALIGIGVYGVRRYLTDAKAGEAPAVLAQIAKSYSATLADPEAAKHHAPKKLASLPAVPATVPRGVKYQSSADDWKAWAPIHFALVDPQYFQYEVVAAKDGKSAEIFARGDLDGNGKNSLYRLKVVLDPKTGQLSASEHSEDAPLE